MQSNVKRKIVAVVMLSAPTSTVSLRCAWLRLVQYDCTARVRSVHHVRHLCNVTVKSKPFLLYFTLLYFVEDQNNSFCLAEEKSQQGRKKEADGCAENGKLTGKPYIHPDGNPTMLSRGC